jgi:hypothetical protein
LKLFFRLLTISHLFLFQHYVDIESGLPDYRSTSGGHPMIPGYELYAGDYGSRGLYNPGLVPPRPVPTKSQWKMDRRIKLTAYISVVVLAALILIIVVVILTMFFQRETHAHEIADE